MKVIIGALGSAGDVFPCIEIGSLLKEKNHDVYLLANDYFRSEAVSRGLSFVAVGDEETYVNAVQDRSLWKKKALSETYLTLYGGTAGSHVQCHVRPRG